MTGNSKWQVTKDESGNAVYTWKSYEVRKVYERKAIGASYLNPEERPTYELVNPWKATYVGNPLDTDPKVQTPTQLMDHCEQHDQYLA